MEITCPPRSGQGRVQKQQGRQDKVTEIFKGQVSGYENCNLLTCEKYYKLEIFDISHKDIDKEKNTREHKRITVLACR